MKRKSLLTALLIIVALLYNHTALAAIECCCQPIGCHFPPLLIRGPFAEPKDFVIDDCYYWEDGEEWKCSEQLICLSELQEMDPLWCTRFSASGLEIDGSCDLALSDDCESEFLLGIDHPGLDILRRYRDEVLIKSNKGKRLIAAYYQYSDVLIEVFKENPGIEVFATELLEKMIVRLVETLGSDDELLIDEIAADINILIDELNGAVENPQLKRTLRQIKRDIKKGKLF